MGWIVGRAPTRSESRTFLSEFGPFWKVVRKWSEFWAILENIFFLKNSANFGPYCKYSLTFKIF